MTDLRDTHLYTLLHDHQWTIRRARKWLSCDFVG